MTIDDLATKGVLHTPTSAWGLRPRASVGGPAETVDLQDLGGVNVGGIREANEGVAMALPPPSVPAIAPITPPVPGLGPRPADS